MARSAGRSPALVRQSLERLEREIHEREAELSRLVALIAREAFSKEVAKRHKASLAALRKKLAEAKARASKAHRALQEIERGAEGVASSRLARIETELEGIEGQSAGVDRARAALELVAELSAEEPARRLSVKSADKLDALAYAEDETPGTMLADLAASAAGAFAPSAAEPELHLGKSLDAQRRLGRAIRGGAKP